MHIKTQLAIIGGGASGLIAAITAADTCKNINKITIFEGAPRVGKKLLATGNGRCNLTNMQASAKHYYGDTKLIEAILHNYPPHRVVEHFVKLGMLCKEESEGRIYPYSLQAATVLDILRLKAEECKIETLCDFPITKIKMKEDKFLLETSSAQKPIVAEKVIIATGGKAAPQLGSTGIGYQLAKQLGHTITPLYPALTLLLTPPEYVKSLKGMRSQAVATLLCNGKAIRHETGEVQFTEQGLSGICMFQFSRHAATAIANKGQVSVMLDLMPDYTMSELVKQLDLTASLYPNLPVVELLKGFINKKVGEAVVKTALAKSKATLTSQLSKSDFTLIASTIKQFTFPCIGVADWKQAQITAGGVSLAQLSSSLESKLHKGLYFAGELLNIDGDCGGYNLHWAWVSGMTVGKAVARSICNKCKGKVSTPC